MDESDMSMTDDEMEEKVDRAIDRFKDKMENLE